MDSKNSKTSNLTDKMNLKRSDKYVALLNLSICHTWKIIKMSLLPDRLNFV